MNPSKFLCRSDALIEGEFIELDAEQHGRRLFLVATRHHGQVRVWQNVCPHQGRPLNWAPNKFLKDPDGNLVCAAHGAVFEPDDGRCISGPCQRASLTSVTVEDDGESVQFKSQA